MAGYFENLKKDLEKFKKDHEEEAAILGEVGPYDAKKIRDIKDEAFSVSDATGLSGRHNGPRDAFRHAYWSCETAKQVGVEEAEVSGNIHEKYGQNPPEETEMDLNNNAIGRKLAVEGGENVDCKQSVWDALNNGQLQTALTPGAKAPTITY